MPIRPDHARKTTAGSLAPAIALAAWCVWPGAAAAAPWFSPAPDIVLYCTPALSLPLHAVAARYTAAAHVAVHIFVDSPDGLVGLIRHRARADLVVADAASVRDLAQSRLVQPDTVTPLGVDPYVLAQLAPAGPPPAPSPATLVAARPVILPDPTTAASFDGAAVLRTALPGVQPARLTGVADTPTVIASLRTDRTALGVVQQTEARVPGIVQVAVLPVPPAPIDAALVTLGQSRAAADLLAFMASPIGRDMLRGAGLDPAS